MSGHRAAERSKWPVVGCLVAIVLIGVSAVAVAADTEADAETAPAEATPATTAPPPEPGETTAPPTSAPAPPTTASPDTDTTAPPPTTPVVAAPADGVAFFESFDGNVGLDRFDTYVFHRNVDVHEFAALSGGSWSADHDLECGTPDTQRTMAFDPDDSMADRRANAFYLCRDHLMTTMGDVDNYSIAAFSPAQAFDSVSEVRVEVNLTDLGNRQWWKIGVLSTDDCPALDVRCMYSDIDAADLDTGLATPGRLIVSWSGGLSSGHPGGLKIGDERGDVFADGGAEKAMRHPVVLTDHRDGTVTFAVADQSVTMDGAFPACPCRVVIYDHNYTPNKNEAGPGVQAGYTWHWDNVEILS